MGAQDLLEGMSYSRHVLQVNMSYRRSYLTGGDVLLEDMSYRRTCLM